MAKLIAPLLSFRAHKALGKKLTYRHSKGQHLVQAHAIPSNPKSPDQTTQRDQVALAVAFWKHELACKCGGAGWTTAAAAKRRAGSGYQYAISSIAKMLDVEADPSYVVDCDPLDPKAARFEFKKVDGYGPGDEGGLFDVWVGASPTSLTYKESLPLVTPFVTTSVLGEGGDVVFVQLFKDDLPRGGIHEITLLDGEGMGTDYFDNIVILGDAELQGDATGFPAYTIRPAPPPWDFSVANFVTDGTKRTLDLSAIVPVDTYAVSLFLRVRDNLVSQSLRFYAPPALTMYEAKLDTQVGGVDSNAHAIVHCTPARTIYYLASNTVWTMMNLLVTGWFV